MHLYPFIFVFGNVVEKECVFSSDPARDMQQQQEHSHHSFVHQTCSPFLIILVIFFFLVQMNKRCVSSTAVWLRGLPPYLSTSGVSLSFSLSLSKHTHSLTLTLTHTNFSLFRTLTATHYYHSIFNVIVVKVTCKPSIRSHQQL